jgi:hypothetical protein
MNISPDRHHISLDSHIHQTTEWLRSRGYRGAPAMAAGSGVQGGIVFCRKNEPVTLALPGDTLRYDGSNITIEE